MSIKKIVNFLTTNNGGGLFHDSRKDVNTIAKFANSNAEKINELVEEFNRQDFDFGIQYLKDNLSVKLEMNPSEAGNYLKVSISLDDKVISYDEISVYDLMLEP